MDETKENQTGKRRWATYVKRIIASEISVATAYFDRVIQWLPRPEDDGALLAEIVSPAKRVVGEGEDFPDLTGEKERCTAVLINGVFNHHCDIGQLLDSLKPSLARTSRLIVVLYNPYLAWLYKLANLMGFRRGPMPTTFITRVDLFNLLKLSGFELVRTRSAAFIPWRWRGVGDFFNRLLPCIPLLKWLGLAYIATIRPVIPESDSFPSISCVVPARNEKGNMEAVLQRIPELPGKIELIFVEGGSTDGTWEEIQRLKELYKNRYDILALQQEGRGKADAVRLGFSRASGDLLTILDADLTMPAEKLERYYNAYCLGVADFVNGSRLVYPMEDGAMRFLNRLGNKFFARALSWVLDTPLSDSLCGTKLLARHDYRRMIAWRRDFGDFDPFGDFELLFPASELALGVIDIPVRYGARRYGETNISRFYHGLILLKMTLIGFFKIKLGCIRPRRTKGAAPEPSDSL